VECNIKGNSVYVAMQEMLNQGFYKFFVTERLMNCKHCGRTIAEDSNFCTYCGTQTQAHIVPPFTASQSTNENQYLKRGKEIGGSYLNFVLETLKAPVAMAEKSDERHFINGIITIILFSFFFPLVGYMSIQNMSFGKYVPFSEMVFYPFLYFLVFFACLVAVMYFMIHKINDKGTFQSVVARFGALLLIPLLLNIVSVLLAIVNVITFTLLLSMLGLVSVLICISLTVYSYKNNKSGFDVFYAVLISYIAVFVLIYIFGESFLSGLIKDSLF
jgi:hypothetical protein